MTHRRGPNPTPNTQSLPVCMHGIPVDRKETPEVFKHVFQPSLYYRGCAYRRRTSASLTVNGVHGTRWSGPAPGQQKPVTCHASHISQPSNVPSESGRLPAAACFEAKGCLRQFSSECKHEGSQAPEATKHSAEMCPIRNLL